MDTRVYSKDHQYYLLHKEHLDKLKWERRERNRKFVQKYKLDRGCSKCGYNRCATALDCHHRDPTSKLFSIGKMAGGSMSIESITREIEKCDILCRNCHAELHEALGYILVV